jgi:filamentous hemagglutinin family protein
MQGLVMGEYCLASSGMAVEDCRHMRYLALGLALFAGVAEAQIVGNGLGTSVNAPTGAVTISGGTSVGTNLFHSFSTFNVATGDSATFAGAGTLTNIIARVTGGASFIDGTLKTAAGANTSLWLLNPVGVAFGQNASLDLTGSFHASTAHALKFGASGQFDMAGVPAGTLSVSPSAFVFLAPPAAITVNGANLAVLPGRNLSLTGGNIGITNATLHVPSGQLSLASVAGAGEVTLGAGSLAATGTSASTQITLTNANLNTWDGASPTAPGTSSGPIFIRGGQLTMSQSTVSTAHTGAGAGSPIDIALAGDFAMNGGFLETTSTGTGNGGAISLQAANISAGGAALIDASAVSSTSGGVAGAITLDASGDVTIAGGAQVTSVTYALAGQGGDLTVNARNLTVTGSPSMINVATFGDGDAGNIFINVDSLSVANGGRITAASDVHPLNGPGIGAAGTIDINAVHSVVLTGGSEISTFSAIAGGGSISIRATDLVSLDHSRITTSVADGSGNAGSIFIDPAFVTLNASQIIANTFNGLGGLIDVITGNLVMDTTSVIQAEALGPFGVPGTVQVSAPNVDAGSALGVLAGAYVDPSALLRESCAARGARAGSSFIGAGRGALPAGPDSAGFARYALAPSSVVVAAAPVRPVARAASALQGCS